MDLDASGTDDNHEDDDEFKNNDVYEGETGVID